MKIEQIDKEQVLEYIYSKKDIYALHTLNMDFINLCVKSIYKLRTMLDNDNYVYFILDEGDSNE